MSYSCKILAIDGGGIRGIIPAYILQQIEAAMKAPIYQIFDVVAGTSTGGLIALGLTTPTPPYTTPNAPLTASAVLNLYMTDRDKIFVPQNSGGAEYYGTDTSTNPPSGIEPWLQSLFPNVTLSQAQTVLKQLNQPMPKQVLTTCFTANGASGAAFAPYVFNWADAAAAPGGPDDYCVWEAARATSAAPSYFPLANVGAGATNGSQATQRWGVDGGVTANNPGLYGLAEAFRLGLCNNLNDVLIVSLGTGIYDPALQIFSNGNWSYLEWAYWNGTYPLIDVLTMSNVQAPDQQLQLIMPQGNYFRLDPAISAAEAPLDGTDTQALETTAENFVATGGAGYQIFQNVSQALG